MTDKEALEAVLGPRPSMLGQTLTGSPNGAYERLSGDQPTPHRCRPPGWWRRWRDGVKGGAIWRCSCGVRYEFRPWEIVYPSVGRPGSDHHPWWRLFEMGPPPKAAGRETPHA